ncbi:MAG: arginase family protein [Polyangiales bacterium]
MAPRRRAGPLVTFPQLSIHRVGERVSLANRVHGTRVEATPDVLEILAFFREPATLAAFDRAFEVDPSLLDELIRQGVLVDAAALPVLLGGSLERSAIPFGQPAHLSDLRSKELRDATHVVVGAPFELGVTCEGGARGGPREIRRGVAVAPDDRGVFSASILDVDARARIDTAGVRVLDLGDLQSLPTEGLDAVGARLRHVLGAALDASKVPLLLGGDHALTLFALDAVIARHGAVGVLHFDAHLDLNGTVSWLNHANVFAHALARPEVKALRQIGVRAYESLDASDRTVTDRRLSWVTAREVHAGITARRALQGLPRKLPCYLSFDVDALDPSVAPETGAPVVGGLLLHEVLPLITAAMRTLNVVAADFMEVAESTSRRNSAAASTARVLTEVILAGCPRTTLRPSSLAPRR